jgi:hypothetical protein
MNTPQPDRAAQAAERIAEITWPEIGMVGELASVIRPYLADAEARAQAAERRLAEVRTLCGQYSTENYELGAAGLAECVLAILNREDA